MKIKKVFFSKPMMFVLNIIILLSYCYIDFIRPINYVINYLAYIFTFVTFFILLIDRKFSKFSILLIVLFICGLIPCILNQYASISLYLKTYVKIVGYTLYMERAFIINSTGTIKAINIALFILTFINFLTIIIFPNGLYETERYTTNWFFKYDNAHIFMYLPSLVFNYLNCKISNKKIDLISVINFMIITYCILFCFSTNSVIAYAIFVAYLVFRKKIAKIKIFNSISYYITYIVLFFSFVIFKIQEKLEWLIVGILNKKITLTGRVHIWEIVLEYIKRKPYLGYGLEETEIITRKYGSEYFTHAHNTILDVLYKGGIVYLLPFMLLIYTVVKELYKYKENMISKCLSIILLCCFIMMNFEARQEKIGLYIILVTSYSISYIIRAISRKDNCNE